mmetsp:Transcript_5683/g.12908  ORF Transcript_5683/g.12908 Transcript_5683/m.12908 type:complete len:118 (-) Transcript_5683:865-1218(-)
MRTWFGLQLITYPHTLLYRPNPLERLEVYCSFCFANALTTKVQYLGTFIRISSIDNSSPCSSTVSPAKTRLLPFFVSSFDVFTTEVGLAGANPSILAVEAPSTTVEATARSAFGATG